MKKDNQCYISKKITRKGTWNQDIMQCRNYFSVIRTITTVKATVCEAQFILLTIEYF